MKEGIQKKSRSPLKDRGQYALGFSVIALMLYVAGFPMFLLFFVGVLAFFIWKVFSAESRSDTRRIFEFYLAANEILREDDRHWYGFEIQETIARGESVLRSMSAAPPLVYFCLGALYQKLNDHTSAVKHFSQVLESPELPETSIMFPPKELREYVRTLRKIERYPAEAPMTSSAVRALERARKKRGLALLEESRALAANEIQQLEPEKKSAGSITDIHDGTEHSYLHADSHEGNNAEREFSAKSLLFTSRVRRRGGKKRESANSKERKTISEVLHDIYDENIQ